MKKRIHKRMLAWVLTVAMVLPMVPVTAFAEEASKSTKCTHSHDETCGYVEAVDEIPCNQECTDTDEDGLIDHEAECAYTPAVEGQPCTHVHDETCGEGIVEQSEKVTETEAATEEISDREKSLRELIALLGALPDPMAYLAEGTENESILDQLAKARAAVDSWLAGEAAASSGSEEEREQLQSLILRLEGLEHIRDTEMDCLDVDCPYHYPEIIQQQMAQDETPKLLTLDDLVEDYGVEPPMQTFGRLRSASVPHPQTLMLTEDNENNSHTGSSDDDIDIILSKSKGNHPIEMSFTLTEVPTQSAYLAVKAYDVDEDSGETDYVYLNDDIFLPKDQTNSHRQEYNDSTIGYLSGTNATWNTTILRIPLEKLKVGKNTISVTIASGWVVKVDWMQLVLDGGAADENIQEFSLNLEEAATSGNNVTVQSSVTVRQTGKVEYTTEYTLTQNATGNALDACFGTVSASETIALALPLDSPTGIYTITGILKESATEAIKATDSISFYFLQGVGVGPKISHTLTPDGLTNQDVTITVSAAEAVPEAGITEVSVSDSPSQVSINGSYSFTVDYKLNGSSQSVTYTVNVDNIDKQAPVITYSTISVFQDEEQETVKKLFADALSVSDTVKLASEPLSYTIPQDISKTSGAKTITVTATDAAGNTTTQDCIITVIANPVRLTMGELTPVSDSKDSYTLNAVLDNGSDWITETGFVWGVMPNPTLELNNGSLKTASVVKATGQALTGTATGLISGVEYYARAYAKVTENGKTNAVYSDAVQFGFGIPQYGTFTIQNNGSNTFTVTRSGGSEGEQTVYFRTVNGSAVGGTHFTHQNGTLTFNAGETTQTITITEQTANTAYSGKPATAYSNANRTYSVEIYRVTGGGTLGTTKSATRTLANGSGYTVDRSIYDEQIINGPQDQKNRGDYDEDKLGWTKNSSYDAAIETISIKDSLLSGIRNYWTNTAQNLYYQLSFIAWEEDAGYQAVQISPGEHLDTSAYPYDDTLKGSLSSAYYMALFEHDGSGKSSTQLTHSFPRSNNKESMSCSGRVVDNNYVLFDILQEKLSVGYGACGNGNDKWYTKEVKHHFWLNDITEPQLLGIAPMAEGTYLPGDPITVALVFDEIVDRTNSTLSNVSINTNVGTLTYAGGADTNVLYFTGTVASTVNLSGDGALKVTEINNSSYIKDMCSTAGTTSTATSGSSNVIVDATKPTVTITANTSGSLPQHKATITATDADTLQYAWTKDEDLPAYGWRNVDSGTQLTESRGAAGATETWYLHVLATSSAGATTHKCQSFTFQQPDITSVSVREGNSTSDTDVADVWKPSKYIVVTYQGTQTSGTTLTFAGPDSSAQTIPSASGKQSLRVTKNGTYTVTLKDSYGNVISKTIEVKKIDTEKPTVTLRSGNSTDPDTVYNSLNIAVLPEDAGGSGLAKVEYAWTNTTAAPTTWNTLTAASDGSYQAVYDAAETTKTTKYLHVKVTDGAGNVSSVATSGPYQVSKEAEVEDLPTITVTGNPTEWTNSATLTWTATQGSANIQTVYTPDGVITGSTTGSCTVTKNGVYPFVVMDANGNSASAEVNVTWVDSEAPKLTSLTAQGGKANGIITLVDVTDNCTVIYDNNGNYSSISGSGLQSKQYKLESESTWTSFEENSITVTKNGTYIIQLTDQVGNNRAYSVKMDGIDATAPKVTCTINATANASSGWYTTENPVVLTFADEAGQEGGTPSGIQSVQYQWVTSNTTAPTSGLNSADSTAVASGTVTPKLGSQGTWYLYYKVTDKIGNVTEGFSGEIKKDTYSASSVITGPTTGQPISTGLAMQCQVTYGPSGGRITGGTDAASATLLGNYDPSTGTDNRTATVGYTANTTGTNAFTFYRYAANGAEGTASPNSWPFYVRKITFHSQGGSTVEPQLVWYRSDTSTELVCAVTKPSAPTRTGYTFGGWYTDAACTDGKQFDFAHTQVKANITLYTKWTAADTAYKVSHYTEDLTGGTWTRQDTDSKTGTTGAVLTLSGLAKSIPGFTYKEGKEGDSVVTTTTILADGSRVIDLYYTRNTYTLTLNQGTGIFGVSGGGSYKYGQSVSAEATVSDGYTWRDWTGDRTSTDQAFSFDIPASNVTLTANATLNQYTVTFDANGHGTAPGSQTVSHGGNAAQPTALTATGYVFGGWYTDVACTDGKQFDFAHTQVKANIILYAKWTLNQPSVTLTAVGGTTNSGVVNAVYNNGATVLTLKAELSNRADSASGIHYTYAWYKGGVQLDSTDESLRLQTVSQSGIYKVEVTAHGAEQTAIKASETITVNIAKATPALTVNPTAITYGDALSRSSLTGGEAKVAGTTVAGSFAWAAPDSTPAVSDSNTTPYTVVFTPEDTTNYRSVTTTLTLKVNPKPITAVWTKLTAAYNGTGQAPECSTFVGLVEADVWQVSADFAEEQRLTNAGTKRLTAVLGGVRAANYQLTNPHVNFTVQKAPVTFAVADNFVQADGQAHKATVSASANGNALDASQYTITYRNAAGQTVEEPVDAGTYVTYAELINPNYRHSGTADGTARQIGVLTIYQNQTAKTYTVEYATGAEGTSEVTGDLPTAQTGVSEGTLIYMPEEGNLSRTGYAFTGWLMNGKLYQPGETFPMPGKNVTITACWKEATYCISGVVNQDGKPLPHAVVTLKRGSEIIWETTTNERGEYSFAGVIPELYNLVTSYDGITTTVKVLIVDADATQNATLPAGRTNSILEVVAGAPTVIVGNLEKLFQATDDSSVYTDEDKAEVQKGGTVEIRLTVEKVAEPDTTGAALLKQAMQKLPEDYDYQPELYLDLVLQKTVYPAEGSGTADTETTTLSDSQEILESVISLPSNLQHRRFYKVYRIHQNDQGGIELHELTTTPNEYGEYYELNPESTELTIHARKYSVYTVAASDYVAPQPEKPESSGGNESHPDNGAPEEETKVKSNRVNQKPFEKKKKLPKESVAPTEKTEEIPVVIPENTLPEQEPPEEPMPVRRNGKSFVVLNVLLTLLSLVMAVLPLPGRQARGRKMVGLTAAAASSWILLLTLGFAGVRIMDLRTILFALLAAITVFVNLTGTKQDKEDCAQ